MPSYKHHGKARKNPHSARSVSNSCLTRKQIGTSLRQENRIGLSSRCLDKSRSYIPHLKIARIYGSLPLTRQGLWYQRPPWSQTSQPRAMPSDTYDPGAFKTVARSSLSPTLAPHPTPFQPTQTRKLATHSSQETIKLSTKQSSPNNQDSQIASQDDPNDPSDKPSPSHNTGDDPRQSNDLEKPRNSVGSQLFPVLPQPAQSHMPTPQHSLQAAGLLNSLRLSPLPPHSREKDSSSPDAPGSTRDPEKPTYHQGASSSLPDTTSALENTRNVAVPPLGRLSVHSDVTTGPFPVPTTPTLGPNLLDDDTSEHVQIGKQPYQTPNPSSEFLPTRSNGLDASGVSDSITTHNPFAISEALTHPGILVVPLSSSGKLNTGNDNVSVESWDLVQPAASDPSLRPPKPPISGAVVQNGTSTTTNLTLFRGAVAKLEGGNRWRSATLISIMMVMALR